MLKSSDKMIRFIFEFFTLHLCLPASICFTRKTFILTSVKFCIFYVSVPSIHLMTKLSIPSRCIAHFGLEKSVYFSFFNLNFALILQKQI